MEKFTSGAMAWQGRAVAIWSLALLQLDGAESGGCCGAWAGTGGIGGALEDHGQVVVTLINP